MGSTVSEGPSVSLSVSSNSPSSMVSSGHRTLPSAPIMNFGCTISCTTQLKSLTVRPASSDRAAICSASAFCFAAIEFALLNGLVRPSHAAICANNELRMHDFMHYPIEVLNRAARIFGAGGYMLGERLLLRRGLVVSLVNDDPQAFPRRRD